MGKKRLLTAIMFTDIVGYSAAMSRDEVKALEVLHRSRELLQAQVRRYGGRVLDTTGDATLSTFPSAIDAVNCALVTQKLLEKDPGLTLRIGLHVGDVATGGARIYGDGVNVAARLQAIAPEGGIAASNSIYNAVYNHEGIQTEYLGERELKNIGHPIPVYRIFGEPIETPPLPILENKRLQRLVLILLVTLMIPATIVVFLVFPANESRAAPYTLAVLPFMNLSGDSSAEYFSDGITEELISTLTRFGGLKVASRTSAFAFKEESAEITTIADRLNVRNVLEGSVRKSGNQVRISVQLVDGEEGYQRWSKVYERELEDIFSIQEEIARSVASAMQVVVSEDTGEILSRRLTTDITAYDYYLQGRDYLRQPKDETTLESASTLFRKALDVDPGYVRAKLGLCDALLAKYVLLRSPETAERATSHCQNAVEVDPALADTHLSLGELYRNTGRYEKAVSSFEQAIEINPQNTSAYEGLGRALNSLGRVEKAERVLRQAVAIEPGYWGVHKALGNFLYRNDRYREAIDQYQRVVELSPNNAPGYNNMAAAYYMTGDFSGAADAWAKSLRIDPSRSAYMNTANMHYYTGRYKDAVDLYEMALQIAPEDDRIWGGMAASLWHMQGHREESTEAYEKAADLARHAMTINPNDLGAAKRLSLYEARLGNEEKSRELLQMIMDDPGRESDTFLYAARVYVEFGQVDTALDVLRQALEAGHMTHLVVAEPDFKDIRDNERFQALLSEFGRSRS